MSRSNATNLSKLLKNASIRPASTKESVNTQSSTPGLKHDNLTPYTEQPSNETSAPTIGDSNTDSTPVPATDTINPELKPETKESCDSCGEAFIFTDEFKKPLEIKNPNGVMNLCQSCARLETLAEAGRKDERERLKNLHICKCGHAKDKHDDMGLCDESHCNCIEYKELIFTYDPQGNPILPVEVIKENFPAFLKPRKESALDPEILKNKVKMLDIGHTIPQADNPNTDAKYADVDLEKLEELAENGQSPSQGIITEDDYKQLTEDEVTLEELARDYCTTKTEIRAFNEQYLRTCKVVENCSITELKDKQREIRVMHKMLDAMEQGVVKVLRRKVSEETKEQKEAREKREKEDKAYDGNGKIAAERRARRKASDKHGVIKGVTKSKRDRLIDSLMAKNPWMKREQAEKLVDD